MKILKGLQYKYLHTCNITIGVFDGFHIGHQLILKKLQEKEGKSIVITFSNHPFEILNSSKSIQLITPFEEKLKFLENIGIDIVILIEFSKTFANISYKNFLEILKNNFSFNYLIVGEDVKFGKNRLGDKNKIKNLEKIYNFKLEVVKKIKYKNKIISSTWIRSLIKEKNFDLINILLNRSYFNKETICHKKLQQTYHVE